MDFTSQTKTHQHNIINNIIISAKQVYRSSNFSYEQLKLDEVIKINSGIIRLIIASIRGETNIITTILNSESMISIIFIINLNF